MSTLVELPEQAQPDVPAAVPRADTLAASVVILLVMTAAQRVIGFGRGVLFCRWLPVEELGQWDVAFAFLMLAAPVAVLGLPGSYGRYAEYYRQRGQFHAFLLRTGLVTAVSALVAIAAIVVARGWFSQLIFGESGQERLVVWLAVCLAAVILHNSLSALFVAVRMYRVVTVLQFLQSLGFAAISLALLVAWPLGATSVVIGYAAATVLSAAASIGWLKRLVVAEPDRTERVPSGAFWARLMPFAVWVWITNLLSNLFELIDRYMIVHHSGMSPSEALQQVGNYHTSRIVPLLFVAVAGLLASIITPHLTHDWEAGQRRRAARRLNLTLKLLGLALLAVSTAVLFIAPTLFAVAFENKFSEGLAVLPCTLAYCAWFGTLAVAVNYLWCAERAGLVSLPLLIGLLINVALNRFWLPTFGLPGAVWATTVANLVTLSLVYVFSRMHGMQVHPGTWAITLSAGALCLGPWVSSTVLVLLVAVGLTTSALFTRSEKHELVGILADGRQRLRDVWRRLHVRRESMN